MIAASRSGRRTFPLETPFECPLIHRRVTARIVDTDSHLVWIYFHDGRFGPLDPSSMRVAWISD